MSSLDPDTGCRHCGTTDNTHLPNCPSQRRKLAGAGPRRYAPRPCGTPCDVCEGPCRYDRCTECGGHSEHNWGCPQTATATT